MVGALATGAEGPGFKTHLMRGFSNFFCSPGSNWVPSKLWKVKVMRKRNDAPPQSHHCQYILTL